MTQTVTFESVNSLDEKVLEFLDSYFEVSALNYTDDGKEQYVGYLQKPFDEKDFLGQAKIFQIILPKYRVEILEDKNWLTENVIKFEPIDAGDFCVYGIHQKRKPKTKKIPVQVYAATAFGSTHQTTSLCLEAISDLINSGFKPHKVLDVGTGSGILAIALAKKLNKNDMHVTAVDIDMESVNVAGQNVYNNGVCHKIDVALSDGFKAKIVQKNGPYQLIVANILARPLISMSKQFAAYTHCGDYAIISGFTQDQVDWLESYFKKVGFKRIELYQKDHWCALLLQKKQTIQSLQSHLDESEAFLVNKNNMFIDEDVKDCENVVLELSGFSGSAGSLLVSKDKTWLFVDGRYTLQAHEEVFQNIDVVETSDMLDDVSKIVRSEKFNTLKFNPWAFSKAQIEFLKNKGLKLKEDLSAPMSGLTYSKHIFRHKLAMAGLYSKEKCCLVADKFKNKAEVLLISSPQELSWISNMRAKDLPDTPVLRAFGLLYQNGKLKIFHPKQFEILKKLLKRYRCVLANFSQAPFALLEGLDNVKDIGFRELQNLKLQKNKVELRGFQKAHIRDGVAMVRFLYWLEQNWQGLKELDIVNKLHELRSKGKYYFSESFRTIAGINQNGAIVHYQPTQKTNKKLGRNSVLLVDSGGQYLDGTTDITRSVGFSKIKDEVKIAFTEILKAHIALASAKFKPQTPAFELDKICRQALNTFGKDYKHGTGHSVGHFSDVHEPPFAINPKNQMPVLENYVTSIEPGFYEKGKFGVRIENLYYTKRDFETGKLQFEPLTLCPIDLKMIEQSLLTKKEKEWLNAYHQKVFDCLSPYLNRSEKIYLKRLCQNL